MASTNPVPVRRLTRTHDGLTGVSGGLADYIEVDPLWIRVSILAVSLLTFPLLPIAYVAAWLIIPKREAAAVPPPQPPSTPTAAEAHDAAVAMAQARAEVDAIDRTPPFGPMPH